MAYINNIYFNYIKLFYIIQVKGRKIMNDELRKHRKEIWQRMNDNSELEWSSSSLRFFCRDNKEKFKKKESKEALNKILEYATHNLEKVKLENEEINKSLKKLWSICNHEILIPDTGYFSHQCPICMKHFNPEHFPETTLFIINDANYWDIQKIKETLEEMITKDDFIEELDEYLSNLQEEKDIKIRRRYL